MLERLIEQEVKARYDTICEEKQRIEGQLSNYKNKYNEICNKYDELKSEQASTEGLEKSKLNAERTRLLQELEQYQKLYKEYSSEEYLEMKRKASQYDVISEKNRQLNQENLDLNNQIDKFSSEKFNYDSLKHKNEMLELTIRTESQLKNQ